MSDERHRAAMHRLLYVMQIVLLIVLVIVISPSSSGAGELIYTLQLSSFASKSDAVRSYKSIEKELKNDELDNLRIEKVGRFHTVRLGKFQQKENAAEFRNTLLAKLPSVIVMKAYIKDERIVRMHPDGESQESTLTTPPGSAVPESSRSRNDKQEGSAYSDAVNRAQRLIEQGKNDKALAVLAPYTSDPSHYPVAVSDYIATLTWEGRHAEAIAMYEALPGSFPRRAYLIKNISKSYYESGNYSKALSGYKSLLDEKSADEEVFKGVVYSLIQMEEYEKSLQYAGIFLRRIPGSTDLSLARAGLLVKLGRYTEAMKRYHTLSERDGMNSEVVFRQRDDVLTSLSYDQRIAVINAMYEASLKKQEFMRDYILILILYQRYEFAVAAIENSGLDISGYDIDLQNRIAWAYFKTGTVQKAASIYLRLIEADHQNVMATVGYSYCLSKEGRGDESLSMLEAFYSDDPRNVNIIFARAYAFEQTGRFWPAIREYDRIVSIDPENRTAQRLRLMALSDIGARTYAYEGAKQDFADDTELQNTFQGDLIADRIKWKEYQTAMKMMKEEARDKRDIRSRYDGIIAAVGNDEMQEAVDEYERLSREGIPCPEWVLDNVASAYLYLEQPQKALDLYDEILRKDPESFRSRMGKFYVLQELRRWDEAREILDALESDQAPYSWAGKQRTPNWERMDVALARGWLFIHEDRLREAEEYFRDMYERAPRNTNTRSGLAHTFLWRGWPRKAYQEFNIIENLDPALKHAETGKIETMNELSLKQEARDAADRLLERNPRDKTVKEIVRKLQLEEMRELETDFSMGWDDEGFEEITGRMTLHQPVSLYTQLYGYLFWSTASDREQSARFRRTGAGIRHILNSYLQFRQAFSLNFNDGKDFGSYSEIFYTPDDYWEITASYDSFSTDVPLRARVFDIEADKLGLDIAYVESDWRTYSVSLSRQRFSDTNERYQGLLGYEQGLWIRNNWRERIYFDVGVSSNSLDDAPYFNPDNDFTFTVTHLTEHTVRRMFNKSFVYRIYLAAGGYKQAGFSWQPVGSVRYEHDIAMSDTNSLLYGFYLGSDAYDGESVTRYGFDLNWRLLF